MKKEKIVMFLVPLMLITACTKMDTSLFRGNYSFKTSGYVTMARDATCLYDTTLQTYLRIDTLAIEIDSVWESGDPTGMLIRVDTTYTTDWVFYTDTLITAQPDTITLALETESGQMDITEIDAQSGEMVIIMNITGGDILVYYACAADKCLTLEPTRRVHNVGLQTGELTEVLPTSNIDTDIIVSGSGVRYDNIVLFNLVYNGSCQWNGYTYNIIDSKVDCRAKRNE